MLSLLLPVAGTKRGGVARVAHDLAQGLTKRGHDVTMWSGDPAPWNARYEVRRLPGSGAMKNWLGLRLTSGYLGNVLAVLPDYSGAEAIVAHGDSLLLPWRGIPVLRIMHGSALDEARTASSWIRKTMQFGVYLQELATSWTQPTVAIGRHTQGRYPASRWVIPNGVDTTAFGTAGLMKSAHPSVLFVGTLEGRKRGKVLLEWFAKDVRGALPHAELWMVSEKGPARDGVSYFPGSSDQDLRALYGRAWVLAAPSTYEGFGLPYVEAMASGTAVIATANPGSRDVLDGGRYGRLVERDKDFGPALLALLRDAGLRGRYAELGRERARDLSLERMLDRYEMALATLTARPLARGAHA